MRCPEGDAHATNCLVQGLSGIMFLCPYLVLEHIIWNNPNISVTMELNVLCFLLLYNKNFGDRHC